MQLKNETSLIIFDCDGVLVESESIAIAVELAFFAHHGARFEREAYIQSFMGLATSEWQRQLQATIAERFGVTLGEENFVELDELISKRLMEDLVQVKGAREAIENLPFEVCVASSAVPDSLRWKLTHVGLIDLFDENVFSSSLVEHGKPAPDLFLLASDRMGHKPSSCIVVEDSSNGVTAGKRAGMVVIGFDAGAHCPTNHRETLLQSGADFVAGSYSELTSMLRGIA